MASDKAGALKAIRGKELINKALAGVGKPIKLWVCRVSVLNLASLKAENMAIKKAIKGR